MDGSRVVTSRIPAEITSVDPDACNPVAALEGRNLVVTMYGRPYKLTDAEARQLVWELISRLEDLREKGLG